ncbi:MAG: threonine--tRNA ligase [Phycisphaerales bacterium]
MPRITLPDGSVREFDKPVSGREIAESIGAGLARAALGVKVDGELRDLSFPIDHDARVSIVTAKGRDGDLDPDGLYLLRHSCAHVMAEAIQRVVPEAQLVYGPPVETGFYYDIRFPEDRALSTDDFEEIERIMGEIIKEDRPFKRYDMSVGEGLAKLSDEGSKYKIDNAEKAIDAGSDSLSFYATGEPGKDWEDLCRGPHAPSTGAIGAFKVMSLASSYWHGDENSDRLTRVYGVAFPKKKDLEAHLALLEEAKKRDHRTLGKQLGLFTTHESVGTGLVMWMPKGAALRRQLEIFIREARDRAGFQWVNTPHVGKLDLYRTSGHFPYYAESQFPPLIDSAEIARVLEDKGAGCGCAEIANAIQHEADGFLLKPMNCPHHIKVFDAEPHSYRDLPVRLAEFGTVYRWEQSGECHGMTRVRGFTQDDSHIFCAPEQLADEIQLDLDMTKLVLEEMGFEYRVRVSLRDPESDKYVGSPENWEKAEAACIDAAKSMGVAYSLEPGEAAFYGPKIDFVAKDSLGREWQLGTVQVDYNLPERFDLSYIGADNQPHRPVMIHCAPFGSFERFVGMLIEHYSGDFPLWLSPEQIRILPISEKFVDYAREVKAAIEDAGDFRVALDAGDERVQAKIRAATEAKIPYMLVVGGRDAEAGTVSVRHRTEGDLGSIPRDRFVELALDEVRSRGRRSILDAMREPAPVG